MDKKVEVASKFLFQLYEILGKGKINKLEDFKNVTKEEFVTHNQQGLDLIENMKDEIFATFTKKSLNYAYRNQVKHYVMNFTKYLCKEIARELISVDRKWGKADGSVTTLTSYYVK